ncbi:outer membrane protein [Dysgonomonas hofstadii]|uniref:Outer membrane protein n=1 Tax=Dysgonomonas hofstadii TaxID=637886 RepID=A0A840CYI8_9BACT|nr:OmpH family outer membrane protein [Dysgonomonas hofstadii]MBB4037482.1 outer membrane protein [Dysgonomonas hofstadii]
MRTLLLLLFVLPTFVVAQNKLAYVNVEEVFSKMPELKDVESKIAVKSESVKKNIDTMEAEYETKSNEYEKMSKEGMTEAIAADKQKELLDLQNRYRLFVQNSQQEMEKERRTLLAPLEEKLMKAIKEVGDENGYSFIFNSGAILHAGSDTFDANPQLKTKLGITN